MKRKQTSKKEAKEIIAQKCTACGTTFWSSRLVEECRQCGSCVVVPDLTDQPPPK